MVNYFMPELNPSGKYYVKLVNYKEVPGFMHKGGSLILIESGILNMRYDDFLRMCRDIYGGELIGKNWCYPSVQFKTENDAWKLCNLLNPIMDMYVNYRKEILTNK